MKFENSVIISPPAQQEFEFVTNPKNNAKWQTDALELEMTSENHFGVGATYRCVNRFMRRHIESEGIVNDYSSDKSCRILIRTGSFTGEYRMFFRRSERRNQNYCFWGFGYAVFQAVENNCKVKHQSADKKRLVKIEVHC